MLAVGDDFEAIVIFGSSFVSSLVVVVVVVVVVVAVLCVSVSVSVSVVVVAVVIGVGVVGVVWLLFGGIVEWVRW